MTNRAQQPDRQTEEQFDQLLNALQQQQPVKLTQETDQFAQQLVSLANRVEPHPAFKSQLRMQLMAQAQKPPESNLNGRLLQQLDAGMRSMFMKRFVFSLAGLTAVIILAFVAWNRFGPAPSSIEPAADIAAIAADPAGSAANPGIQEAPVGVEQEMATDQAMYGPAIGRGGGGGGYGWGGDTPFINSTITLNADLPGESEAAVLAGLPIDAQNKTVDVDQIRQFAAKFGIEGDVYFEWYAGMAIDGQDDGSGNIPYTYRIFDGKELVTAYVGGEMYYENTALFMNQNNLRPLPFAERRVIAEQFLQERGLLDFEYEVRPSWGTEVQFYQVLDGKPVYNWIQMSVNVNGDGQIMSVSKRPLIIMDSIETAPLRPASEAWTHLEQNLTTTPMFFNIVPSNPEAFGTPFPAGQKTHWEQTYAAGQTVVLNSWIQIFRPVDGSLAPRLQTNQGLVLDGDAALLEEIADATAQGNNLRVQGEISGEGNNLRLNVTSWEYITGPSDLYLTGTVRNLDGKTILELPGGFPIEIANPPADLPVDSVINISTTSVRYAEDGVSAIADWTYVDLAYVSGPPTEDMYVDPFANISNVEITDVALTYYYLYPYEPFPYNSVAYAEGENAHMIPVWRFSGVTSNGDYVEFGLPALASMELPTVPTE